MSFNILSYIIYLIIIGSIITKVGLICYHNGTTWTQRLSPNDNQLSTQINKLLLLGYYLLNLGYAITIISFWPTIDNWQILIENITIYTGQIFLILALLHCLNIIFVNHIIKIKSSN